MNDIVYIIIVPDLLPRFQVDEGAIKFVLNGADIMCQGLTSNGGKMDDADKGTIVGIYAENKVHACAVGITLMDTQTIRDKNKGICVNAYHYLGDGLYMTRYLE